jgi:polygalacturonase
MEGIQMAVDANNWFESGPVRDMLITNNRFIECRRGGIRIEPSIADPTAVVHENIRIEANTFELNNGPAVRAIACRGLSITGNRIHPGAESTVLDVDACSDARVEGNAIDSALG